MMETDIATNGNWKLPHVGWIAKQAYQKFLKPIRQKQALNCSKQQV